MDLGTMSFGTVSVGDDDPFVLTLRGEFDDSNCDEIARGLAPFAKGSTVTLDMAGVTFVDSACLAVFLAALRRGVRLKLAAASPTVRRRFEVTGLDRCSAGPTSCTSQ
jgi:anti-anti-sigma factor